MIRHDEIVSHLRFYSQYSDDPYPPYDAICTVVWESKHVIWVKGLQGKMTLSLWREFARWLIDRDVTLVKLERADNHTMPFASYNSGKYYEVQVDEKLKRWANRKQGTL